jgi:hypothetical protein
MQFSSLSDGQSVRQFSTDHAAGTWPMVNVLIKSYRVVYGTSSAVALAAVGLTSKFNRDARCSIGVRKTHPGESAQESTARRQFITQMLARLGQREDQLFIK